MRNAPPVAYPVGRFVWCQVILGLLAASGAIGLIVWQVLAQVSLPLVLGAWLCWSTCALAALWWSPRQILQDGRLYWSGECWFWQSDAGQSQGIDVSVCFDPGEGMLLGVQKLDETGQPAGFTDYAWLQARAMPSNWHGFRCAVYSRPKVDVMVVHL